MPKTAPLILAFDTSAAHCAAALLSGETILAHAQEDMAKGQAERLVILCQELLQSQDARFADLSAIGVGIGPGNFTGIRIAVSAARGMALGLSIPAIGVSAFDALQYGTSGPCACAVDARRDHYFLKTYGAAEQNEPAIYCAHEFPAFSGPLLGAGGTAPAHPTAIAIAHITRERYLTPQPKPAPLYLRPADAAPARDAPPVILS